MVDTLREEVLTSIKENTSLSYTIMYLSAYSTLFGSLDRQLQQFAAPYRGRDPIARARGRRPDTPIEQVPDHRPEEVLADRPMGECVICKEKIQKGQPIRHTTCAHTYHATCLNSWYRHKHTCPVCRTTQ